MDGWMDGWTDRHTNRCRRQTRYVDGENGWVGRMISVDDSHVPINYMYAYVGG